MVTDEKGLTDSVEIEITVLPKNLAPVIYAEDLIIHEGSDFDYLAAVSVKDDQDEEVTDIKYTGNVDLSKPGIYELTYIARDSKGLESSKTIKVTVNGLPKLTVSEAKFDLGSEFNLDHVEAYDFEDGDISDQVKVQLVTNTRTTTPVDMSKPGVYEVEYTVTDSHGGVSSVKEKIIVLNDDGSMPPTGDNNNIFMYFFMLVLSGFGLLKLKNKKKAQ